MHVYHTLDSIKLSPSACALGMFDGVHLGHRMVLENALREARKYSLQSVVFSFTNHPQHVLATTPLPLLSTLEERLDTFEKMHFDAAVLVPFDNTLMQLPPETFIDAILHQALQAKSVTVGYDFRFGRNRAGNGALLHTMGKAMGHKGFETHVIEPVRCQQQIISSTVIRSLLSYGDIPQANTLLGYKYFLEGTVIHGDQRGQQLGFPTANLHIEHPHRLIPAQGTYCGWATVQERVYPAVCNLGINPTFHSETTCRPLRFEVHLLHYTGAAFYNDSLKFEFAEKLRDERKFDSLDALIAQIQQDCDTAEEILNNPCPVEFSPLSMMVI